MFSSVLVTVPDLAIAERISKYLIERKFAACANYWPIQSMFYWKDKIEHASEFAILLKIRSSDFGKVSEEISRLHPYAVACIVKYDIAEGWPPYLEWIKASTGEPEGD
jgi:periplasmic divalent cation tolerance protein